MPISSFSDGLQKVLSFLPGTYGTSLMRNHALRGVFAEMESEHFPTRLIESMKDSVDCNMYFNNEPVSTGAMYLFLGGTVLVLIVIYILLNMKKRSDKN